MEIFANYQKGSIFAAQLEKYPVGKEIPEQNKNAKIAQLVEHDLAPKIRHVTTLARK